MYNIRTFPHNMVPPCALSPKYLGGHDPPVSVQSLGDKASTRYNESMLSEMHNKVTNLTSMLF